MSQWKMGGALAAAVLVSGCTMGGRGWVPQGPGDYQESSPAKEAPAKPPPAPRPQPTASATAVQAPQQGQPQPPRAAAASVAPTAPGAYTQASRYGDLLFISGQIAMDLATGDLKGGANVADQTRQVMDNIRAILDSHRLTMANVVSVTVYMKDLHDFRAMDEVYETYFRGGLPSRSVIEVKGLPRNALVEISVIAGR